jgi:hypothetical protein
METNNNELEKKFHADSKNSSNRGILKQELMQKSVEQEDYQLNSVMNKHGEFMDSKTRDMLFAKKSLLHNIYQSLFPSQIEEIILDWKEKTISNVADFNIKFIQQLSEYRLQAMTERYNTALMVLKANARTQISTYLLSKMDEVKDTVRENQFKFISEVEMKYAKAESIRHLPNLYKTYLSSIEDETVRYFLFLENLVTRFESIVNEQLKNYC